MGRNRPFRYEGLGGIMFWVGHLGFDDSRISSTVAIDSTTVIHRYITAIVLAVCLVVPHRLHFSRHARPFCIAVCMTVCVAVCFSACLPVCASQCPCKQPSSTAPCDSLSLRGFQDYGPPYRNVIGLPGGVNGRYRAITTQPGLADITRLTLAV